MLMKLKSILMGKEFRVKSTIIGIMLIILIITFFFASDIENLLGLNSTYAKNEVSEESLTDSSFKVHYIDVGQGNSTFVELPDGKTLLIDGGNTAYGKTVADYLNERDVDVIDYLIATHADSDHIGGLNYIFDEFEIVNIYRPFQIAGTGTTANTFVPDQNEDLASTYKTIVEQTGNRSKISRVTSSVYREFISNIYSETYTVNDMRISSNVTVFYDGLVISGKNYSIEFFAPFVRTMFSGLVDAKQTEGFATEGYGASDSNGASAIFLLTCYDETFLFTGDAPWTSGSDGGDYEELDFVNSLSKSEIDKFNNVSVFLVGHHGSSHSSGESLLNLINPKFAVISVGKDNTYGHPSSEVIFRLSQTDNLAFDYLLRTDQMGSICFGKVAGALRYVLEISTDMSKFNISWHELSTMLFLFVSVLIVSVKPKPYYKQFHWQ